jgi:hypothetical protein
MGQNVGVFQHYKHKHKHYLGDGAPFHTNVKAQKSTIITHTVANRKYPSNCADQTLSFVYSHTASVLQLRANQIRMDLWTRWKSPDMSLHRKILDVHTLSKKFIPRSFIEHTYSSVQFQAAYKRTLHNSESSRML